MKCPVLVLSIGLNAVLTALWLATPHRSTTLSSEHTEPVIAGSASSRNSMLAGPWASIHGDALSSLMTSARAAGLPEWLVVALVKGEAAERYRERRDLLYRDQPKVGWWRNSTFEPPLAARLELAAFQRAQSRELRELVGREASPWYGEIPELNAAVPAEKMPRFFAVIEDTAIMRSAYLTAAGNYALLASEQEAVKKIDQQLDEQIRAQLTPREYAVYELTHAKEFHNVVSRLAYFDATEEEFEALVLAEKEFLPWVTRPDGFSTRSETPANMARLREATRSILGESRYAEYERASEREYIALRRLAERVNLPREAADRAFELRASAGTGSTLIADDPSLSIDAKKTALKSLAENLQREIRTTLGEEAATAYLERANSWLSPLERGQAVTIQEDGHVRPRSIATPGG